MKRHFFIKSFFVLAICIFFITSCKNFLDGSKFINELNKEIDFANGSCANVTYTLEKNKGSLEPSGNRKYYIGDSEDLKFVPSQNDIEFNQWVAYDQDNKALGPDVINFENKYDPYTKVTFCKPCTNVRIVPETYDLSKQLDGDYKFDFIEVLNNREETIYKISTNEDGEQKVVVNNCFTSSTKPGDCLFSFVSKDEETNLKSCTDKIYVNIKIKDSNSQLKYLILDTGIKNKIKLNKLEKNIVGYSGFIDLQKLDRYKIIFELENMQGNIVSQETVYVNPNVGLSDLNISIGKLYDDYLYFNISNSGRKISKTYYEGSIIFLNEEELDNSSYYYLTDTFENGLSCEIYSGTDINNLVKQNIVLENYESYDSFKLPIDNIDFNKDNYVKVVVKNRIGKENSEIYKINAAPVLNLKYFDGNNYNFSLKTSINGYETKTFNIYKENLSDIFEGNKLKEPLKTIECKKQVTSFTLSESEIDINDNLFAIETNYPYSIEKSTVCGLYSNSVKIIQNDFKPYNEDYFNSFSIRTGEKSSDKYTFSVNIDKSYLDYLNQLKQNNCYLAESLLFMNKNNEIIYEIDSDDIYKLFSNSQGENVKISFDLSYKDMISFADDPIIFYVIDSNKIIHYNQIYFTEVKYDDNFYENKTSFINKLKSIDITPPYCTDLNIKAFEDHLEMDLPQDNFDKGINQYHLYTYLYWIPFKDEWEGLELNQINVLDEHYDDYNSIDEVVSDLFDDFVYVHYFRKYSSPDTKINVPFAKLINDKYLLVMRAIDENGNEGYAPVLIFGKCK